MVGLKKTNDGFYGRSFIKFPITTDKIYLIMFQNTLLSIEKKIADARYTSFKTFLVKLFYRQSKSMVSFT